MLNQRLSASPCCNAYEARETFLRGIAEIGFSGVEAFTTWCAAHLDYHEDPAIARNQAAELGLRYTSLHLPMINETTTVDEAIRACHYAAALGASCVLVKADSVARHIACDGPVINAARELGLSPVIQNHKGSAIETVADVRAIVDGLGDTAPDVLLEVGHYHSVGQHWAEPWEAFRDRITLVHVKDQVGPSSVAYGEGEVDLAGLIERLEGDGYRGRYVLEIELFTRSGTWADTAPFYRQAAELVDHLLATVTC